MSGSATPSGGARSAAKRSGRAAVRAKDDDSVSDLELFFDLVYVFAVTRVTALMLTQGGWLGIGQGLLVLSALWFSWTTYAWLTTTIDPDEGATRLAIFATMVCLLVASLAVPRAFGDDALIFGIALLLVRTLPVVVFRLGPGGSAGMARTLGPFHLVTGLLILSAGIVDGPARYACWIVAIVNSVAGPFIADLSWADISPGHFSKRHGGFIIIALGESIVSAGIGVEGHALSVELIAAAALAVAIACGLWWTYFDTAVLVAARRLSATSGRGRERLARDAYTFLHWPMVAGVILLALGLRHVFADLDEPLGVVPAFALCGGLALYMSGLVGFSIRTAGDSSLVRISLAISLLILWPVAHHLHAILALAMVTAVWWAPVAYEILRHGDLRDRRRHPGAGEAGPTPASRT